MDYNKTDYNKIIGMNIRYERQLRNLTIDEFAKMIDMAPGFLGLIKRGKRGTTLKNLCKIADFFSISLDAMLNRDVNSITEEDNATPLDIKRMTVKNLVETLNEGETDFVNVTVKQLIKLRKTRSEY
ncbi:MAG: helix-turn-helix domain-containing protein [Clostridiales bacterium]|nr:helix-turn-helix domain-containing protein [Clostridiales bacterium]